MLNPFIKPLVVSNPIEYGGEFLARLNQRPLVVGDSNVSHTSMLCREEHVTHDKLTKTINIRLTNANVAAATHCRINRLLG